MKYTARLIISGFVICAVNALHTPLQAAAQEATFGDIGYPHGLLVEVETLAKQQGIAGFGGSGAAAFLQSEGGSGSGSTWYPGAEHLPTLQKVCNILGYKTYVRSTCKDFERSSRYPAGKCNFHSPDDNDMVRYNPALGKFKPENANSKYKKTFVATITCRDQLPACSDGKDNDGDGKKDLADPGCSGPNDNDEKNPNPSCSRVKYKTYHDDDSSDDDDNCPKPPQCSDGKDNDGDGKKDMADPGCSNPNDNDEKDPPACSDGKDNDWDGKKDMADPGCDNPNDNDEKDPPKNQCEDGKDNDGDGKIDFPADPGCTSLKDNDEKDPPACSDGKDNDGDGKKDLADPGCDSPNDNDEKDPPACSDGKDNDWDGKKDLADPGCDNPGDNDEKDPPKNQCEDGKDNDGDGKADFPADPGCTSPKDDDEKDDPKPEAPPKLSPSAKCIDKLPNGSYVAHFGYQNDESKSVTLKPGLGNSFSPGVMDRGQPSVFEPGAKADAFTVAFDGNPLQWVLGTSSVTVSAGFTDCNPPPPAPTCSDKNITELLITLDSGARAQRDTIVKALRQLKKLNPAEKVYAAKAQQQANGLYNNAWNTTWSIPVEITTCLNTTSACSKADLTAAVAVYNGYSASLKQIADEIAAKLLKVKKNPAAKKAATNLKTKSAAQNEANLRNSAAVPSFDDQC